MGDIKAFLLPPVMEEEKKVIISKRFVGEDGSPVPFVIRTIDQETNERLQRRASKKVKGATPEIDPVRYGKLLVEACVAYPDFKDAELCAYYKTSDPLDVPGRMLTAGEYNRLVQEINAFNGFSTTGEDMEEIEEEAKN